MSAKPVKTRIGKPRGQVKRSEGTAKPRNFTEFPLAKASYSLSVHDPRDLPRPGAPEIAFAGRSNAGKSSAINTLAGRRRLAFVSKTPGRTQLINFFSLGDDGILVDLPGYGFAKAPHEVREQWDGFLS